MRAPADVSLPLVLASEIVDLAKKYQRAGLDLKEIKRRVTSSFPCSPRFISEVLAQHGLDVDWQPTGRKRKAR